MCTLVQQAKKPKLHTPVHLPLLRMPRPGEAATPVRPSRAVTPNHVGPVRNNKTNKVTDDAAGVTNVARGLKPGAHG